MLLIALMGLARAECPANDADILLAVSDAEKAFLSFDVTSFQTAYDEAFTNLACLDDSIDTRTAASVHYIQGVYCFLNEDTDCTAKAFARARAIDPNRQIDSQIAPEGGPLWELWDLSATAPPPRMSDIRSTPGIFTRIDGRNALQRPTDQGAIVQYMLEDGNVVRTKYVAPGEPMPGVPAAPNTGITDNNPGDGGSVRTSGPLKWVALGGLAASVGLFGYSGITYSQFENESQGQITEAKREELQALKSANNATYVAAWTVGAVSVGTGVIAFTAEW